MAGRSVLSDRTQDDFITKNKKGKIDKGIMHPKKGDLRIKQ